MKKPILIFFSLISILQLAKAQDFPYGRISVDEMNMKSYAKDTAAHAVVLNEFGKSRIAVGNDDNIRLMYEYHVKIKIFDSKAFDEGTVEIPVYNNSANDSYEEVSDIKGITYYKDESGFTQKAELEEKKIYPQKENKHWAIYKFALPGIHNGSVIEYSYKITSPYMENFHSWEFQRDIPKINSEYEVHIPAFWNYNIALRGPLKLIKNLSELERPCFETHGASCDCSQLTFGIKDIPAFYEDEHMTSKKNFMSAITFELVEVTSPYDGVKHKYTKDWKDIDYNLKSESEFGGQMKRKSLVKDRVATIIAGKTDDLSKAKAIYTYWQNWFKWNQHYGIWSVDGISKSIDSHTGSDADINLSLIAALSAAGLNTDAVLLSTRENGAINTLYPVIGDFNYVVARVNIDNQSYLLDATDPLLPFGVLPLRCLNDKGRVFNLDKPSYFMDMNLPQRLKSSYNLDVTLQDDGKFKGTLINYSIGYEAYLRRKAIKAFNSTDEYVENFGSKLQRWKIIKSDIKNLDSLDAPLSERYEVEINVFKDFKDKNRFTMSPYFWDKQEVNPFKLAERLYPVDWGMPQENRFVITVHLPENCSIENPAQPFAISLPNNGGKYISSYEPGDKSFSFTYFTQLNKPIYGAEEYPYLKEFYNKIIQSQKSELVLVKK